MQQSALTRLSRISCLNIQMREFLQDLVLVRVQNILRKEKLMLRSPQKSFRLRSDDFAGISFNTPNEELSDKTVKCFARDAEEQVDILISNVVSTYLTRSLHWFGSRTSQCRGGGKGRICLQTLVVRIMYNSKGRRPRNCK